MTGALRIFLTDLAHDYQASVFSVPLGIGFIGEYLRSQFPNEIEIRLFKSPDRVIEALDGPNPPHIAAFSNYSWNIKVSQFLMARVRAQFPETVIVQGGPHIRIDPSGIASHLTDSPDVDYYTMQEGEFAMEALVRHMLTEGRVVKPAKMDRPLTGIAYLNGGELVYQPRQSVKDDLLNMPSPYLSGLLDEFLEDPKFIPLFETNRGCPFACTFCAWGVAVLNKVRKYDLSRILEEIDYIAHHSKARRWQGADANFGMFKRDIEIAHALRKAGDTSPYLRMIGLNWAKNSSTYCTEIAHILHGLNEPLIAVQSTDPEVLKNSKRANIKMTTITDMVDQGRKDGVAMVTDVLAGLPGETLESHLNTLRDVFSIGFEKFNVGQIRLLPGSELEEDAAREEFGIRSAYRFIDGYMGRYAGEPICEYEECVVGTHAMSEDDMQTLRVVHFLCWAMWNSGIAQPLLRYLFKTKGVNPLDGILTILEEELPAPVEQLLGEYRNEAENEWFESPETLIEHFHANVDDLLHGEKFLKLNMKYLARILLDPDLAKSILNIIAARYYDSTVAELVEFCTERIFFIEQRSDQKVIQFSVGLQKALSEVYSVVLPDGSGLCKFEISQKQLRAMERDLELFGYQSDPVAAMSFVLQTFGATMYYDFSFGSGVEKLDMLLHSDSFDYRGQLEINTVTIRD